MAATGSTPNYSINYPQGSDPVSLSADLQEMATDIDSILLSKLNTSGGTMTGALVGTAITDSSSSTTGAFKTAGGMGIAKSLNVGQNANITGNVDITGTLTAAGLTTINDDLDLNGNIDISGTLTLATKTVTLGGNFETSGAYNSVLTLTGATNVTLPTTGTLATLAGSETLSNKTLTAPALTGTVTAEDLTITGVLRNTVTPNSQADSYTLVLTDRGKMVECTKATANNLTVPLNSSVAFPIGTVIDILQTGAGQVTVVATGGVTINATPGLKLRAQWSAATLIKRATDTWVLIGDLSA